MTKDTVGNRLKKARLDLGVTYEQAYADLKIRPDFVRALEDDRIDSNIGDIYIKAFIRKYAEFLGFESDKIINEMIGSGMFTRIPEKDVIKYEKKKKISTPRDWKQFERSISHFVAAFAIMLMLFVVLYAGFRFIAEFKELVSGSAVSSGSGETGEAKESADAGPVRRPAVVDRKTVPPPILRPVVLKVNTVDKVWVRVKSDGKIIFENILEKDSQHDWRADKELELWVGRGEALNLTLNGEYLGSPGSGSIRSIKVTSEGIKVRKR